MEESRNRLLNKDFDHQKAFIGQHNNSLNNGIKHQLHVVNNPDTMTPNYYFWEDPTQLSFLCLLKNTKDYWTEKSTALGECEIRRINVLAGTGLTYFAYLMKGDLWKYYLIGQMIVSLFLLINKF